MARTCLGLVLIAVLASGCASSLLRVSMTTMATAETEGDAGGTSRAAPVPYFIGAGSDAVCVALPLFDDPEAGRPSSLPDPAAWAMLAPVCFLDLPLSVSLDTLLLPVDVWSHQRYERAIRARRPPKVPGGASSSRAPAG